MDYESDNIKDLVDDDDLVVTISRLRQIVRNQRHNLEAAKGEIQRLSKSRDTWITDLDRLGESYKQLEAELKDCKKGTSECMDDYAVLCEEMINLRQALEEARTELTGRSIGFEDEAIHNATEILDNALKGGE